MISSRATIPFLAIALLCGCSSVVADSDLPAVYYPGPPDPPRIQFLRHITVGSDLEIGRSGFQTLLFGEVEMEKMVMAPYGAEVRDGITYVCDIQQGVILTLDLREEKLGFLELTGRGALQKPTNLDFAPDGKLYVADIGRRQVTVYDREFRLIKELGPWTNESRPVDVEVTEDRIYIVDSGDKQIRVFSTQTFEELAVFGSEGESGNIHKGPTNIAVGADGTSYVVDTIACRIFVWDAEGNFVRHIGQPGDIVGDFARPKGIAIDGDVLYVIDAAFENCQILRVSDGEPLMFFGNPGGGPGNLYLPAGVWVGTEGLEEFEDYYAEGFTPEKLIVITNLYGPAKVSYYALGKADGFDYTQKPAMESAPEIAEGTEPATP